MPCIQYQWLTFAAACFIGVIEICCPSGLFDRPVANHQTDRPSSARRAVPCIAPGEAPGGRRNPGCDSNLELRPEGATLA